MEELIEKVAKTERMMESFFHKVDTFDSSLDIEETDAIFRKFEKRIANLRNELEVEDFLLQVEQQEQNENNI